MDRTEAFAFLTRLGKLKTRKTTEIARSPFSIGMEALDRNLFDPEPTYAHLSELGAKWARIQPGWMKCESARGVYDFSWLDRVVDQLLSVGVQPWMNLGYGNQLYMPECDHPYGTGWTPLYSQDALEGWKSFVRALAIHYQGRITHFEIWNEPDHASYYWKPIGKPDPDGVVRLTALTAEVIRQHIPAATIIGGVLSNPVWGYDFTEKLLAAGLAEHIDRYSVHFYNFDAEVTDGPFYQSLQDLLQAAKPGLKLWQGESGAQSSWHGFGAGWDMPWTEELQARWLVKRMIVDIGNGVELANYFHLSDLRNYPGRGVPSYRHHCYFGLLRGEDYSRKPSYDALQSLATIFADDVPLCRNMGGIILSNRDGAVYGCRKIFRRGNWPVIAYWDPASVFRKTPASQVDLYYFLNRELSLRDPVLIDPLTQDVYFIPYALREEENLREPMAMRHTLQHLPYMDYPLFVTDRRAVEMTQEGR